MDGPRDEGITQLFKDIAYLHKELSDKYEELSMYFYPEDNVEEDFDDDEDDDY